MDKIVILIFVTLVLGNLLVVSHAGEDHNDETQEKMPISTFVFGLFFVTLILGGFGYTIYNYQPEPKIFSGKAIGITSFVLWIVNTISVYLVYVR